MGELFADGMEPHLNQFIRSLLKMTFESYEEIHARLNVLEKNINMDEPARKRRRFPSDSE